jgi:hypothetical protein
MQGDNVNSATYARVTGETVEVDRKYLATEFSTNYNTFNTQQSMYNSKKDASVVVDLGTDLHHGSSDPTSQE